MFLHQTFFPSNHTSTQFNMAEMGFDANVGDPLPTPAVTNNPPEHTLAAEEWKHRPPYLIQSTREFGEAKWRGSCECQKISYSLRRGPIKATFSHARSTQIMHGAPVEWTALFQKSDISFDKGCNGLSFSSSSYDMSTSPRVSCSSCHTPIMHEGKGATCLIFPPLIRFEGSLDERRSQRDLFKPKYVFL